MKKKEVFFPAHILEFVRGISWKTLGLIVLYLFGAFFFYGSKLLAPLHVPIALVFVYFAGRRLYRLYRGKRVQRGFAVIKKTTVRSFLAHKVLIIGAVSTFFLWYTFISLVPTDKDVFGTQSPRERQILIEDDTERAAQLVDMLKVTGDALLRNSALYREGLTTDESESLRREWNEFLAVAIASEGVTDVHRYFPQIPLKSERELQAQSFTISYSLYMLKFAYFHRIIDAVGFNNEVRSILNEYSSAFGSEGSYDDVTGRFFATNSLLRRTVGYLYYLVMTPGKKEAVRPEYRILLNVAKESQSYLLKNAFSHITARSITATNSFNDSVSGAWLPIQKTVFVDVVGNIHVGDRKEKFITEDDIATMRKSLHPGDIFVARKNWYASNVGIPGFWTHAGLYTGTLDEMRTFFEGVFPYTHGGATYATLDELISHVAPEAFLAYTTPNAEGHMASVIESETKGTGINVIEHTAHVDYFGAMRTTLSKRDILASLLRAFQHYKKPYDYQFSLVTKDEIFCSELVYDAYVPMNEKSGIILPTSVVSGMELVAPNDIVKKFVEERGSDAPELTFAYFLDARETDGHAFISDEKAFIESFKRPKFSALQE